MDKRVLQQRRRQKQAQLRRRKMMRLCCYVGGFLLAVVFLVRGIILPIVNPSDSAKSGSASVTSESQVASAKGSEVTIDLGEDTAASSKTEGELEEGSSEASDEGAQTESAQTENAQTESSSEGAKTSENTDDGAIRQPLKGSGDLSKVTVLTSGWHEDNNGKWYQNVDGTYFADGFQEISGSEYCFDENGYVQTGWVTKGVNDYYFNEDGSLNPEKKRPLLCLTFDDGPGQYTEKLLNCLEENGAHATFFMLGELIRSFPDEVAHMQRIGCELGNHSYDHAQLTNLDLDSVAKQFNDTDNALIEVCGSASTVARAPYGSYNQSIIDTVGKPFFMWSLDSLDWSYRDVDLDYNEIMNGDLSDGTIILMHDIHEASVECACRIIPELIEKGYKLVTVSEMAQAKNVVLQNASYSDFWQSSLDGGWVAGYQGGASSAGSEDFSDGSDSE